MPGWSMIPSTTSRPPLTRLTTPAGRSISASASKAICWVRGTCSEGLRMNALPQAIAKGRNQKGTIAGKVERNDRRADPDRLAHRFGVDAAGDVFGDPALDRRRHGAGALDHLDHPGDLGAGVGDRLAHLHRHRAGQLLATAVERLAQGEEAAAALDHRDGAPGGQRGAGGADRGVEVGGVGERHPRQGLAAGRCGDLELGARRGGRPGAADVVVQEPDPGRSHRSMVPGPGRRARLSRR